jgi:hypothetical protein
VTVFEVGVYEGWLDGTLAAYQALGRTREAGYVLLALRRFADAEACFDPVKTPIEWACSVSKQGRQGDAARALAAAGYSALAAMELEAAGDWAGAKQLWHTFLADARLAGKPYEFALATFNLAQALRHLGEEDPARRTFARTQQILEELADEFETRGERERAFDCYRILVRMGKDTGSFENAAEGYLNCIRLLAAEDQKFYVLQFYEDFLAFATQNQEWHAAAALAGEAADFSLRSGLVYDRHYRERSAALWAEAARHNATIGGPPELSENALVAAVDAACALGDFGLVGRLYSALGNLPVSDKKKDRYTKLATRHRPNTDAPAAGPPFPEHLRRSDAYQDVWREDLVEWELAGSPIPVLTHIVVERIDHLPFVRLALRALLSCAADGFDWDDEGGVADLALALGRIQVYEVLRPLGVLGGHPSARVRAAVMSAASQVYYKRTFGLVRSGLDDAEPLVKEAALRALRALHFRDGLEPLARLYRDTTDESIRFAALESIAAIGNTDAGMFLLDVARQETGALFDAAVKHLTGLPGNEIVPLLRQYIDLETGTVREALAGVLAGKARP